jgi:hypothetical protein
MTPSEWSATNEQPVQPGFCSSTQNPKPNMARLERLLKVPSSGR